MIASSADCRTGCTLKIRGGPICEVEAYNVQPELSELLRGLTAQLDLVSLESGEWRGFDL
jgi:hypothetical protein